ncbi:MAG: ribonuclease Z [Saprospiraceae bacterium]|nr:ribonuclease Z [Saprospiraceae bacterium]
MISFELTILGSNSALPSYGRFPTSQILNIGNELILIDCGEGCQMRMADYKIKRNKISTILISHLHGDHVYGLPGVITSFNHTNRTEPLVIYGPHGIKELLETLFKLGEVHIGFELKIIEMKHEGVHQMAQNKHYKISAFPVFHRIPTYGYRIEETRRQRNIMKDKLSTYQLTIEQIKQLKEDQIINYNGRTLHPDEVCHPIPAIRSYSYCADSLAKLDLIPFIQGSTLLYFESTYLDEMRDQAHERGHATAKEAGQMAKAADVKQLVIGHYSSRYKDPSPLLIEAQSEFPNTVMGYDGARVVVE